MQYLHFIWLGIAIILGIVELLTFNLTTIWMAISAVICFILHLSGFSLLIQIIVFFSLSVILIIFTKPFVSKYLKIGQEKTNIDAIIGKEGIVLEDINNLKGTGLVKISGQNWTARSLDDDYIIESNSLVYVNKIEGVKVIVAKK